MSFDQTDSGRTREQDLKLAEYLMKNKHSTPFEMVEIWLEMKLPIFVARQFVRHRTVTINEVSGRYVQLPAEWYIPEVVGGKPVNAKQGQTDTLDQETQDWFKSTLDQACRMSYEDYDAAIKAGVAAEHARLFLHVNHYTHWLWKQDLHNIMHFLSLRDHSHAQIEAQAYGKAVAELLYQVLPNSMELYMKYRRLP
jgi:thymidylate synthase (FAD)